MLIHLNEFEEATKQMDDLRKQSVEMYDLVHTELNTLLKEKKREMKPKSKSGSSMTSNLESEEKPKTQMNLQKKSEVLNVLSYLKQVFKNFIRIETLFGFLIFICLVLFYNLPQRAKENLWKGVKNFFGIAFEI
jgi:hypothetical protein